jgi:hypothetical protein
MTAFFTVTAVKTSDLTKCLPVYARSPYLHRPLEKGAPVRPQTLDSFSIASYNSEGYGGGIRNRLHEEINLAPSSHGRGNLQQVEGGQIPPTWAPPSWAI